MEETGTKNSPGALSGIRVLDFTHALAGPYATMILGDMGAEVLKVEHPGGGDRTRRWTDGDGGLSLYFGSVNRGKQSLVLDLKNPAGKDVAHRLAQKADIVVQNMGPGVAERLGLTYEKLSPQNPRLIYAVVTGFGLDGPWADRVGMDPLVQALSGSMSVTGEPDRPPSRVGYSVVDLAGGLYLAIGILGALNERNQSGKGQLLDVSLMEAQLALMENAVVRYLGTGVVPGRTGSSHAYETMTRAYETRDGWMVAAISGRNWQAVCQILGRTDWLEDPDLRSQPEKHSDRLIPEVQKILASETRQYWAERLGAAGVLCTPVNTMAEAVELPPIVERGFIQETIDAKGRRLRVAGSPLRLSRTPGRVRGAAPLLGQHTKSSVQNWLGITDDEFKHLQDQEIFKTVAFETRGFW